MHTGFLIFDIYALFFSFADKEIIMLFIRSIVIKGVCVLHSVLTQILIHIYSIRYDLYTSFYDKTNFLMCNFFIRLIIYSTLSRKIYDTYMQAFFGIVKYEIFSVSKYTCNILADFGVLNLFYAYILAASCLPEFCASCWRYT